jgi:tRNA-splicing ligase RtcB
MDAAPPHAKGNARQRSCMSPTRGARGIRASSSHTVSNARRFEEPGRVPVLAYGIEFDPGTLQAASRRGEPSHRRSATGRDTRRPPRKGRTIGSVISMKGAIVPSAVALDIGCGMVAETQLAPTCPTGDTTGFRSPGTQQDDRGTHPHLRGRPTRSAPFSELLTRASSPLTALPCEPLIRW